MPDYQYPFDGPTHRSIRSSFDPRRVRMTVIIIASLLVVAAAAGFGSYFVFGFNIRAYATCKVTYVSTKHFSGRAYWNITSSCGKNIVNAGDFLRPGDANALADSLVAGMTYKMTFEGRDREIIAAEQVAS
jgi:hypothetical protein